MSSDVVVCPQCGTSLQNSEGIAGQVAACPECRTHLQMPPLSRPAAVPPSLAPGALPSALAPPPPTIAGSAADSTLSAAAPTVQPKRSPGKAGASVADRLQKRSNPWVIVFGVVLVIVLIAVGTASYFGQQADAARRNFERQVVGNWEVVPGQSQFERWDFAFHSDHHLQMALGTELSEGRWRVASVRGSIGYILIEWPDDAPQTLRVQLERGTMRIALDGVGDFAFRAAVP